MDFFKMRYMIMQTTFQNWIYFNYKTIFSQDIIFQYEEYKNRLKVL